jgi:hypothetical protein
MGLSPDALYEAVFSDVSQYVCEGRNPLDKPDSTYKQFGGRYILFFIVQIGRGAGRGRVFSPVLILVVAV